MYNVHEVLELRTVDELFRAWGRLSPSEPPIKQDSGQQGSRRINFDQHVNFLHSFVPKSLDKPLYNMERCYLELNYGGDNARGH